VGDNTSWSIAEEQVIAVYNLGALTLPVLDALMKPFAQCDIDEGGHQYLEASDGKDMTQICVELVSPDFKPNVPEDYADWREGEHQDWWDGFEVCMKRWRWR
jgi:hypothetical protein